MSLLSDVWNYTKRCIGKVRYWLSKLFQCSLYLVALVTIGCVVVAYNVWIMISKTLEAIIMLAVFTGIAVVREFKGE
jgi:hypothetical protein